jgi:hypothetical protein
MQCKRELLALDALQLGERWDVLKSEPRASSPQPQRWFVSPNSTPYGASTRSAAGSDPVGQHVIRRLHHSPYTQNATPYALRPTPYALHLAEHMAVVRIDGAGRCPLAA